jgi:hypothetical protein
VVQPGDTPGVGRRERRHHVGPGAPRLERRLGDSHIDELLTEVEFLEGAPSRMQFEIRVR